MAKMKKPTAFWVLIVANYTPAELAALACWADEMAALALRKKP